MNTRFNITNNIYKEAITRDLLLINSCWNKNTIKLNNSLQKLASSTIIKSIQKITIFSLKT